jgi:hypothetical protein
MHIAKLNISYERGVRRNLPVDVGLEKEPETAKSGGKVRGLGTHWESEAARVFAKACETEERRIRDAFRRKFMLTPIEGTFFIPFSGAAHVYLDSLQPSKDIKIRVSEYTLLSDSELGRDEVSDWSQRVRNQLMDVSLGCEREATPEGLKALEELASCPLLSEDTRVKLVNIIGMAKTNQMTRVQVKRSIKLVDVEIDPKALTPHRGIRISDGEDSAREEG